MHDRIREKNPLLKLIYQTSHYATGNILCMLGGFISLPILTRILSTAEYGILSLVSTTVWIALALAKGGLQESAVRFYAEFKNGDRPQELPVFYTTLLSASVALGIAAGVLIFGLGSILSEGGSVNISRNLAFLVAGMVISGAMYMRLSNFLRAEQATKLLNLFAVLQRYSILAFGLYFLYALNDQLQGFFLGSLIGEGMIVVIMLFLLVREGKIRINGFSPAFLKECLMFGVPFVGFELASFLLKIVDRYLVQYFLGLDSVGVYSLAYNLCSYVNDALFFAAWYAVYPIYIELWQTRGKQATVRFLSNASTGVLLISIPIIVGFSTLSQEVITVLASEKYAMAARFLPFLLGGMVFWGFIPVYGAGIYIFKKTKVLAGMTFVALILNIGLNLILIPRIQLYGAAISTLLSYAFLISAVVIYSFKYLKFAVNYEMLAKSIAASVLMYFALLSLHPWSGLTFLIVKILVGTITYVLALLAMDRTLRRTAMNVMHRRSVLDDPK